MQASVENLKLKLVDSLDAQFNVINMAGAAEIISILEQTDISKEVLEATRLGMVVNNLRKQNQTSCPELSKRCRGLIREWQKLVEAGGGSAAPLSAIGNGYLSGSASATASPLNALSSSHVTPRLQLVSCALAARSRSPATALTPSQLQTKAVAASSQSSSACASPQTGATSRVLPNGSASGHARSPQVSTGLLQAERPGSGGARKANVTPVSTPPLQSTAVGNLKLKIKIGGSCPVVTSVVEPCPSSAAIDDVVSSLKENKKRRPDTSTDWEDQPLQKRRNQESSKAPPARLNGIPTVPTIPVLSELSSPTSELKRSKSAATFAVSSKSNGSNELDLALDTGSYVTPGRPSKLKTTMELVAEMTKEAAWSDSLPPALTSEASVPCNSAANQLSSASYNQEAAHELKDSRQRNADKDPIVPNGPRMMEDSAITALSAAKSDLVQRLLDSSADDSVTFPVPELLASSSANHSGPTEAAVEKTLLSADRVAVRQSRRQLKAQKAPKRSWYDILSPIDLELAAAPTVEPEPVASVTIRGSMSMPYMLPIQADHKLLMMPYAEIGLPEFVEHRLNIHEEIVGCNHDFTNLLDNIGQDDVPNDSPSADDRQ